MKRFSNRLLILVVTLFFAVADLLACPSCKEGFKPGSPEAAAGDAYSASVIFMLVVPMLIVTTFTVVIARRLKDVEKDS